MILESYEEMLLHGLEKTDNVIPAKAGIQEKAKQIQSSVVKLTTLTLVNYWIPAFAGMTS